MTHWADVAAKTLQERGGEHLFATAITPSGPIHVGNMREVLTTEAVFRALGAGSLIYIADDYDPLRKVYPFLHEDYEAFVGRPLAEIPCPDADGRPKGCGRHDAYSEHFLEPFLANLEQLGIAPTVLGAYAMYHEGRYQDAIATAFAKADRCRSIIEETSRRQLPKDWVPFNAQCPCGRLDTRSMGREGTTVRIRCPCGKESDIDALRPGNGKLPWRLDWPARWRFLGVTFEAFGKDHGASGGSWDTGVRLVRDVFGGTEPQHIMYEFLHLKGKGAMHSSTGLAVSADSMLQAVPSEVLRYLLMRTQPRKHIDFDPGLGLVNLADEFDRLERVAWDKEENPGDLTEVGRTYELSCPNGRPDHFPVQVSFRHLVTVAQMAPDDQVEAVLRRSGELEEDLDDVGRRRLLRRVEHIRYWLATFAPDNVRFEIRLEGEVTLDAEERGYLRALAKSLPTDWKGQTIHDAIHDTAVTVQLPQKTAFRAVYQAILGQDRGPRAGFFLASMERDAVLRRFEKA